MSEAVGRIQNMGSRWPRYGSVDGRDGEGQGIASAALVFGIRYPDRVGDGLVLESA